MDAATDFAAALAADLRREISDALVAVYLHGSAAFGDFDPRRSDIDLLVILADHASTNATGATEDLLHAQRDCPGLGIEASAVSASAALHPNAPWPFLVHVTTAVGDEKVVSGANRPGDPDLVLHYAVTRAVGVVIDGPSPRTTIGEIDRRAVLRQLHDELLWATRNASAPYAVLNACRALRYQTEGVICSKTEGGTWALEHDIAPDIVAPALAARRSSSTYRLDSAAEAWVLDIANHLESVTIEQPGEIIDVFDRDRRGRLT